MNLHQILTETRNPHTTHIDEKTSLEIVTIINEEDQLVPQAITNELPKIAQLVDRIVEGLENNGRLIYVGAGTSGRLGVLDASECPPTYGTPFEQVIGIIAGGDTALRFPLEGAEDDAIQAEKDMEVLTLTKHDVLIGIAASGRTPYTISAMNQAKKAGATVGCIVNTLHSEMEQIADIPIVVQCGPEVITGSTRMKAGTSQKLVLNMLSTAAMIRLGKVYGNLMVDVQPSNEKLTQRAKDIIVEAANVTLKEAEKALAEYGSTKAAILSLVTGLQGEEVHQVLDQYNGHLKKAIQSQM
ncbi:N-acetylmuramic acid 6-phosphate etherase [Neobacillus sp. D3-1R]|uniref:N-acetylmuramic acid 6-phosphate etherase n=1 Tax=Neobacillus sp. D3-1R TaxID=3445778 RepID=UPI003FA13B40